jgi:hypothetical protein
MNQNTINRMYSQSITDIDDELYSKHSVIKPSQDSFDNNFKYTRIVIDSRVRKSNLYPSQNDYYLEIDEIEDILSVQLVYIDIPFVNYLINKYFNTLNVIYNGTLYDVVLPIGDYSDSDFLTTMQASLDSTLGTGNVTITYNTHLDNYTFTSVNPFGFNFQNIKNSLAMLLGFNDIKNYTATLATNYILNSEFKRNFKYNNYIIFDIDQFDLLKSSDPSLNKSYAVIPLNYDTLNLADNPHYIKIFSPPLPRLLKLHLQFSDRFGNPYDFQNHDHRLEILFTSFKQKRKYGNIFNQ